MEEAAFEPGAASAAALALAAPIAASSAMAAEDRGSAEETGPSAAAEGTLLEGRELKMGRAERVEYNFHFAL